MNGKATVYVIRGGTQGAMILANVSVDGAFAGGLPARRFLLYVAEPGVHKVSVIWQGGQRSLSIDTAANELYFVGVNSRFEPVLMTRKDGESEVAKLEMIDSSQP